MATIGVKVQLDGSQTYKQQMSAITQQTKLFQAQVKETTNNISKGASVFANHIAQGKALENQLASQREQQKLLANEIENATKKYGENSKQVMALETQMANLNTAIANTEDSLKSNGGTLGAVGATLEDIGKKISAVGDKMSSFGTELTQKVTLPLASIGTVSVKAFSDWESAFTGVMKTVDETANTTYDDIAEGIKKMATETASTKEEIAGVAEVAGQLGISADNIVDFTKVMIELGDTTNLSAEDASTSLARIINITGESTENIDKLGSAIVALGNNFATDEASIVEMSNRLASAGTIAGMSTTDIFALSTAMSSVGIQAEAGGTAMTQTLTAISQAVDSGSAKLTSIAEVSGMTAEEFSQAWSTSPITALQAFINGLSSMNEAGESTYTLLDDLGMSGIRQSNMLQSLALASDQLAGAIDVSNSAYETNTALTDEANKRYATFATKLSQTKEKISNVGVEIGEKLLPYVDKVIEQVEKWVEGWNNLDDSTKNMIVKVGAIVAVVGPIIAVIGKVISTVGRLVTNIGSVITFLSGTVIPFVTTTLIPAITGFATTLTATVLPAIGSVLVAIAPFIAIGAVIAGVIAGIVLVVKNWGTICDWLSEKWQAFSDWISPILESIGNFFTTIFEGIGNVIQTVIQGTLDFITGYFQLQFEAWKWLFEGIALVVTTVVEAVSTFVTNAITVISEWINTTITNIKAIIVLIITATYNFITSILTKIKTTVSTWFTTIKTTISNKVTAIKTAITEVLQGIVDKFTELKDSALTWGKDLIDNFISGIKEKWESLKETVSNVAQTVADFLHFSEPKKGPLSDFNESGGDMMSNYANGIKNAQYLVKDAVQSVALDVASTLDSALTSEEIYEAIRQGASDSTTSIVLNNREVTRALSGMGVQFS